MRNRTILIRGRPGLSKGKPWRIPTAKGGSFAILADPTGHAGECGADILFRSSDSRIFAYAILFLIEVSQGSAALGAAGVRQFERGDFFLGRPVPVATASNLSQSEHKREVIENAIFRFAGPAPISIRGQPFYNQSW